MSSSVAYIIVVVCVLLNETALNSVKSIFVILVLILIINFGFDIEKAVCTARLLMMLCGQV